MKVVVFYSMLPKGLSEKVLDKRAVNWDGANQGDAAIFCNEGKDEVKDIIAKSRRGMNNPKPMNVDEVRTDWNWRGGVRREEETEGQEKDENDINYVGKGKGKGK
eukprot:10613461-Lingulodinium_polyedra.AAC.1